MLIVAPPSETKRPPRDGDPLDLGRLSFPELTPTRQLVLDALIETSAGPDAFARLMVGPSMANEVARNTYLTELPTRAATDVYAGPLYDGLDAASLSPIAAERADHDLVIVSALFGALRPSDRIPAYRMHVCARLVGLDRLEPLWRRELPQVLAEAAGSDGLVIDLRSPMVQAVGMPAGRRDRVVSLRVEQNAGHGQRIGDVIARRVRGEAARFLLESGAAPEDPREVATILAERWEVHLEGPTGPRRPWTMTLGV
jgi:cytoplasmic iron level regulating protein YaaA (DUF328/UPF0246 family)